MSSEDDTAKRVTSKSAKRGSLARTDFQTAKAGLEKQKPVLFEHLYAEARSDATLGALAVKRTDLTCAVQQGCIVKLSARNDSADPIHFGAWSGPAVYVAGKAHGPLTLALESSEIAAHGGVVDHLVPKPVAAALADRFAGSSR